MRLRADVASRRALAAPISAKAEVVRLRGLVRGYSSVSLAASDAVTPPAHRRVFCIGNGCTAFVPPQKKAKAKKAKKTEKELPAAGAEFSLFDEAAKAAAAALHDAGIEYAQVSAAVVGYAFSDSTAGQAALYRLGLTGIPVFNVNNACASGSTALCLARSLVLSGEHECVLALGFEQLAGNAHHAHVLLPIACWQGFLRGRVVTAGRAVGSIAMCATGSLSRLQRRTERRQQWRTSRVASPTERCAARSVRLQVTWWRRTQSTACTAATWRR